MNLVSLIFVLLMVVASVCRGTTLIPSIKETEARAWADLVGVARVISVTPLFADPLSGGPGSIVTIEFLTEGVSARHQAAVLWRQALADATLTRPAPPEIGNKYRVYLRLLRMGSDKGHFEPVHPDWGFVALTGTEGKNGPPFIEHTVSPGESLWRIAQRYYGAGSRWRVLSAANFTNQASEFAPPLNPGMRLRIPTFPMKPKQMHT